MGTKEVDGNMTARRVLSVAYMFAQGLPQSAAAADAGLTWAALANSASVRAQISSTVPAGQQKAHQAAAAAVVAMSPLSEAAGCAQVTESQPAVTLMLLVDLVAS